MKKIVFIIGVVLFFIPFFWFKPGEVNLGGDSSRLYFYQPVQFLKNLCLYSVIPSEVGQETITYYFIPFSILLAFLKFFLRSPYLLIVVFYSIMLIMSFLSIYFIVLELFKKNREDMNDQKYLKISAVLAGLFYTFNPVIGFNWDKNLITHNQIFLNPFIFYLVLRFFSSRKDIYAIIAILLSFIFSPNFGFSSAPPFFAFYPLALLFLLIFIIFIRRRNLPLKKIVIYIILFFLIHSFHYIPQMVNLFDKSSSTYERVFSQKESVDNLAYFNNIRSFIKLENNISALPQNTKPLFFLDFLMFVLPAIMIFALILNAPQKTEKIDKSRAFSLLFFFYLIFLFFASGGITPVGIRIYQILFKIPGFGMFRNFFGQFMYVFFFFYAIVLGYGIYLVSLVVKTKKKNLFFIFILSLLIGNSWSFISGHLVNQAFYQGKENVDGTFKMDPHFDEVLKYMREEKTDGKVLIFPFTDFGYQVLAGEGGYYLGPSMIGYLAGKKDFAGYSPFKPYVQNLLDSVKKLDYQNINKLFSLFNIKYVFYNSDKKIYSKDNFPFFPYHYARYFMPEDQKGYEKMIDGLGYKLEKTISDNYHVYVIDDEYYLPHIYVAPNFDYFNKEDSFFVSFEDNLRDIRLANYYSKDISSKETSLFNDLILETDNRSSFLDLFRERKKSDLPSPFVSWKPSFFLYPMVLYKEERSMKNVKNDDIFFDESVFYAEKRINELERWGNEMSIYGNITDLNKFEKDWQEPKYLEFTKYDSYAYWEVSLVRYKKIIDKLIERIKNPENSIYPVITNKAVLRNKLNQQSSRVYLLIKDNKSLDFSGKRYLINFVKQMFELFDEKLKLQIPDTSKISYTVDIPLEGEYQVYVEKKPIEKFGLDKIILSSEANNLFPKTVNEENNEWVNYGNLNLAEQKDVKLELKFLGEKDIAGSSGPWKSLEIIQTNSDSTSFVVEKPEIERSGGLVKEMLDWQPGSFYIFSFDFNTHSKQFYISLYEQEQTSESSGLQKIFEEQASSNDWKKFKRIIPPSENSMPRLLQIARAADDIYMDSSGLNATQSSKIDIRNLSIIQVPHPRVVLRKLNLENKEKNIPKITFSRINPTRYKVEVREAKNPYTLVLLDAFSKNWRVYLLNSKNETHSLRGWLSRFCASIGRTVVSLFINIQQSKDETSISYFSGDVKEDGYSSIFLSQDTFLTWGRENIARYKHFPVNGYANGWHITPDDTEGKSDYELIIEMTTQKLFYGSLFLSLTTVLVLILWLLFIFRIKLTKFHHEKSER